MLEPPRGALSSLRTLQRSLMLPLDPTIRVSGIVPQHATVFKSALSPLGLTFEVAPLYLPYISPVSPLYLPYICEPASAK